MDDKVCMARQTINTRVLIKKVGWCECLSRYSCLVGLARYLPDYVFWKRKEQKTERSKVCHWLYL
ncbi:hypothetical protein PQN06_004235, partial [Klebsiella pneumoniae]